MDEELGKAAVGILVAALGGTASAGLQAAAKKLHSRIHSQFLDVDSDEIFERWAGSPRNVDRQGDLAAAIGILARDYPDFGQKLRELIEEARALSIVHDGNSAAGDQVSSVVTASGGSGVMSGTFHGNAQIGDNISKSNTFKIGGGILLVGLLALAFFYIVGQLSPGSEITQDSTCQEFLEAPSEEALRGLRKVGTELGVRTGSPLAPPAISYACSGDPDARLGDVVLRYKGQF
ncbi:hypothetical protein [Micromonospora chalcea]|uniref:hypothetical protein n=1 Tax=Micromonospora chalcea TaxID=1874 RepID=UPI0011B043ED|nr:hypothetical protein [Micromonospora chalcea]